MPRILFERFPDLQRTIPWLKLVDLPTPVHRLDRLSNNTGFGNLWIKRDDESGDLYGGNKPRKLEFLLADVMKRQKHEVVTAGGDGSNHCVAASLYGARHGIHVTMVTVPQPSLPGVRRNILVNHAVGTTMVHVRSEPAVLPGLLWSVVKRGAQTARVPYFMYFGGSSPRGTLGFVEAGLELGAQVDAGELPAPTRVFVPTGSCGTHAGLQLGIRLSGLKTRVVGVRVTPASMANRTMVAGLATLTAQWLRRHCKKFPPLAFAPWEVDLLGEYYGGRYGRSTALGEQAIRLLSETEGISLEPTYSAKAMAGMLGWLRRNKRRRDPVLFWHTYNGRDLGKHLPSSFDPRDLSPGYRKYFTEEPHQSA